MVPVRFGYLELIFMIPVILVGLGIYFLPTILAAVRHHRNALLIFLIDFLLGWTVVGWVVALIMVFVEPGAIMQSNRANETPLDIAKGRYARGEISEEEFDKIKKNLS